MKKFFVFLICFSLVFISCRKEMPVIENGMNHKMIECVFNVSPSSHFQTKAYGLESDEEGLEAEKKINTLQVFIFDSEGQRIGYGKTADKDSLNVMVEAGSGYDIYAVVNGDEHLSDIYWDEVFLKSVSNLLATDNGSSEFVMSGKLEGKTVSASSREFSIEVSRRAAKVVVRKITNIMPVEYGSLTIEGIYLSNVVTASNLFGVELPDEPDWVNKLGVYTSLSSYDWFADKLNSAVQIPYSESYSTVHTFYAGANPVSTDTRDKEEFSPRYTRLVIKAKIDGVDCYYPVSFNEELPELVANRYIDISEIKIKHPGSDDPEDPVSVDEISVEVTVKPWDKVDTSVEI